MKWLALVAALLALQTGPTIVVTPDSGQPGTQLEVIGSGFTSGERVKVLWDGANLGGTVKVGPDGAFKYSGAVPSDATLGTHLLEAQSVGSGGVSVETSFTVIAETTTTSTPPTSTTSATTNTPTATGETTAVTSSDTAVARVATEPGGSVELETQVSTTLAATALNARAGDDRQLSASAAEEAGEEPQSSQDASSGIGGLIAALVVIVVGAAISFLFWGRSRSTQEESEPGEASTIDEVDTPLPVLPEDIQGLEADWARNMLVLATQGEIESVIATATGLIGIGRATDTEGGEEAVIWNSTDAIHWDRAATLGAGRALLAIPWREGLLVVASDDQDRQINTSCWWSEDTQSWHRLTDQEGDSLAGASFEGGAAVDDVLVTWGRGPHGPGVWCTRDGETWQQSGLRGSIDLIAAAGPGWLAFGRDPDTRRTIVAESPDGLSWAELNADTRFVFDGATVGSLVPFDGGLVAAGTEITTGAAAIWVSDDGSHWLRSPFYPEAGTSIEHLAALDGHLFAVGADTSRGRRESGRVAVWESRDAVSWERVPVTDLFSNAIAKTTTLAGDSILVCGTQFVSQNGARPEAVPVSWRWTPADIPDITEPSRAPAMTAPA